MKYSRMAALIVFMLLLSSCGKNEGGDTGQQAQIPAERAAALDQGPRAAETVKLNESLANRGRVLFDGKSCSDCHTLGEAEMAPDLLGVLDRRTEDWLKMQITQPEWMNEHDPITRQLIGEFDLEMVETGVEEADAEALLHFLLRETRNATP
jgi:mono/diheme cytochrome c family protein